MKPNRGVCQPTIRVSQLENNYFFKIYNMFQKHLATREVQLILLVTLFHILATQMITYGSSPLLKCPNVHWKGDRWKTGATWAPYPDLLCRTSAAEGNAVASVWDACARQWRFGGSWVKRVNGDQSVSSITLIYKVRCPDSDVEAPSVRDRWFFVTHAINAALTVNWSAFWEKDAHDLFIRVKVRATPLGYFFLVPAVTLCQNKKFW